MATTTTRRATVQGALTGKTQTVEALADATNLTPAVVKTNLQGLAADGLAVATRAGSAWKLTKAGMGAATARAGGLGERGRRAVSAPAPAPKAPRAGTNAGARAAMAARAEAEPVTDALSARRAGRRARLDAAAARDGVEYTPNGQVAPDQVEAKATRSGRKLAEDIKSGAYVPGKMPARSNTTTDKPARKATSATKPTRSPKAPAAASKPAGSDVAGVLSFMENVRPVSAQPATPAPAKRTRRKADAPPPVFAKFERGQLRDAVLTHLQGQPENPVGFTADDVAKILQAQTAPVATNLQRMASKGLVVEVSTGPRRYVAA